MCIRDSHYHLVLETPEPNLVAGMAWLQSTYTIRLNWIGKAGRNPTWQRGARVTQ